jgi:glycerol-3-phosphate acyltransferase PlsY
MLRVAVLALAAYLLGSIPFGYMIARVRGVDLTRIGSGNMGSTNIYRALGLKVALLVFLLDAGKGLAGTMLVPLGLQTGVDAGLVKFICGLAVIVGSVASIFMRFRGGKGVATGAGVFLGLAPLATAVAIAVWAGLVALTRYVSLGSLVAAALLPILLILQDAQGAGRSPVFYLSLAVAIVVFVRHRSNLRRLATGQEHRVGRARPSGRQRAEAQGLAGSRADSGSEEGKP